MAAQSPATATKSISFSVTSRRVERLESVGRWYSYPNAAKTRQNGTQKVKELTREQKQRVIILERERRIRQARDSFWMFCKVMAPDFYLDHRNHLRELCDTLQKLYEGNLILENGKATKKLIINMPPRHGKSRTLVLFCMWLFGKDITNMVMTCSYNDDQAAEFSMFTRDGIKQGRETAAGIAYNDVFPNSRIKAGNASMSKWALEGHFFNYLGAGVNGSITGKGCNIAIVDDPIKNAEEAFNELHLEKIWRWYTGTFLSRLEAGGIEIVNMTRWAHGDICGKILERQKDKWFILKMQADLGDGEMLCPDIFSRERYEEMRELVAGTVEEAILLANYQQEPIDIVGRLYKELKTYTPDTLPMDAKGNLLWDRIIAYTDTADEGSDYLCSIVAGVYNGQLYILDVIYTQDGMDVTEPAVAAMLVRNGVNVATIESNSGGKNFARHVEKIIREKHNNRAVKVTWIHQSKNKRARILTNSTFIMENVFFPHDWSIKHKDFYHAISTFRKEGTNKHDDAADALTGLVEHIDKGQGKANFVSL